MKKRRSLCFGAGTKKTVPASLGFVIAILLALAGLPEVGKTEADN